MRRKALDYHSAVRPGKLEVCPSKPCGTADDLSLAYTPGVAAPCLQIHERPQSVFEYTGKANLIAVVSNGTAVLGLGNIGPLAAKPVMEGKAVLFKKFADIDVFDLELDAGTPDQVIAAVHAVAPTFGGINLEDIASPDCFEIESRLQQVLDIPVFHDDQHGTAIVVAAAVINGLDVAGKHLTSARFVVCGAGAAGMACAELLTHLGVEPEQITLVDSHGIVHRGRSDLTPARQRFAHSTPLRTLAGALVAADVMIGVSRANVVTPEMITRMAPGPVILALANPDPEINVDVARAARPDAILATGRSDTANQVNNVLAFPGIFRGALDVRASSINTSMKLAATHALSQLARGPAYGPGHIIPKPFDQRVVPHVAAAVAHAAIETDVARQLLPDAGDYARRVAVRIADSVARGQRVAC